jgi:hypothetical protein
MSSRTAKFVSAILVNILAGLLLTTVACSEPAAADGCLSTPWGEAPAGSQWRYHVDHVNKRNCWYLRRQGGEQSEALPQNTAAAPKASAPPSPPAKPSIVDAHAELRQQAVRELAGNPPVNATGNPANSASSANTSVWSGAATVATRWPDLPAASSLPNATTAANDVAQASANPAQAIVPSNPFAHLSVPMRPQTFWSLVAATIAALAFAGLAALISKRGRARRLRRRVARTTRRPTWETTDDDRIVLSDHPYPDKRDYRPRFGRSAGAAAASSVRARESASRAPRHARR